MGCLGLYEVVMAGCVRVGVLIPPCVSVCGTLGLVLAGCRADGGCGLKLCKCQVSWVCVWYRGEVNVGHAGIQHRFSSA